MPKGPSLSELSPLRGPLYRSESRLATQESRGESQRALRPQRAFSPLGIYCARFAGDEYNVPKGLRRKETRCRRRLWSCYAPLWGRKEPKDSEGPLGIYCRMGCLSALWAYIDFYVFLVTVSSSLPLRFRPQRGAKPTMRLFLALSCYAGRDASSPKGSVAGQRANTSLSESQRALRPQRAFSPLGIYSRRPRILHL